MKGLESMPLKYLVITIILFIVVGIGFWQIDTFMKFNTQKNFKEDIVGIAQKMDFLRSGSDHGSVSRVGILVPKGYEFSIDIDNDTLIGNLSGEIYSAELDMNITWVKITGSRYNNGTVGLGGGNFEFSVYYGELEEDQVKDYTIVIK